MVPVTTAALVRQQHFWLLAQFGMNPVEDEGRGCLRKATKEEESSIGRETRPFSEKCGLGWIRPGGCRQRKMALLWRFVHADVGTLTVHCRISTGRSVGDVKPAQEPGPRRRCHGQAPLSGARQAEPCHYCRGLRGWRSRGV